MNDIIKDKKMAEDEIDKIFLYFLNRPDICNFYWFVGYIECIADCGFIDRTTVRKLIMVARKKHIEFIHKG